MSPFERGHKKIEPAQSKDKGPQPPKHSGTHGGTIAMRLYRDLHLDLRRGDHKAIRQWQLALIADLAARTRPTRFSAA